MKLQDQVCSLDLAKRLKELGVNQESYFWWQVDNNGVEWHVEPQHSRPKNDRTAAFTGAELGEMLLEYADTEADARAKMLIYLIENKLHTHV